MLGIDLNLYCVGAAVLGVLLGYAFAYSARQQQPNANEVAALLGTVLGGSALSLVSKFDQCADAFPLYVIGVAVGYLLYLLALKGNWTLVQHLFLKHGLQRSPLIPWRASDPCCNGTSTTTTSNCSCGSNTPEAS
jgi:hypothetical protein